MSALELTQTGTLMWPSVKATGCTGAIQQPPTTLATTSTGQAPFSSAEAKAIKSAVTKIQEVQQLAAYLSFHSFAQVKA